MSFLEGISVARYRPGDGVSCYTVLGLVRDAPSRDHRQYAVRANCCGTEGTRMESTLAEYGNHPKDKCIKCAQNEANSKKRGTCGYMERFGPVKVIGRGEKEGHWKVVWDCCGKEIEMTRKYLITLRAKHRANLGGEPELCVSCANRARVARYQELMAQAKARAKERGETREAARLAAIAAAKVAARVTAKEIRPIHPKEKPFIEREGPIKVRQSAVLQEGVISAALAWPRPGRREGAR